MSTRPRLNRDRVVAAALRLVDEEGASALSMRNLAATLGVKAMSLYHHVRDREDLLDGLVDLLVATGLPIARPDEPWDESLRNFTRGIRRTAQRHPAAFQLVGLRPLRSNAALAPVRALVARLVSAGFSADSAIATYRLATAFARGYALAEAAGLTLTVGAAPEGLAPDVREAVQQGPETTFERALELIVAGARSARAAGPQAEG